MHIPDGFMNAGTSIGAGAVAAAGLSATLRGAAKQLEDRQVPLAGLVAAFIFAVQMLNFPVAAGTSGHLIGGALAAVLVGPWAGALCLSVVVLVQALFADGGLTALGLNILNMALVASLGGWLVFRLATRLLPRTHASIAIAAAVAAAISVPLSAAVFCLEYAIGGNGDAPLGAVFGAMLGVHVLIGVGEAVITAMTVGAVLAARPDLVYGARDLLPRLRVEPGVLVTS